MELSSNFDIFPILNVPFLKDGEWAILFGEPCGDPCGEPRIVGDLDVCYG